MIDTRDLAEKRDELKEFLVDDFNLTFEKEIEDFDELTEIVDNSDNEDVEEWRDDKVYDFEYIDEINDLEDEITNFIYGETLIPNDDFTEYCKDMVENCYNLKDVPDFIKDNINWKGVASDLEVDYSSITYQGERYLVRAYRRSFHKAFY